VKVVLLSKEVETSNKDEKKDAENHKTVSVPIHQPDSIVISESSSSALQTPSLLPVGA
jgi:hypothetical protein